MPVVIERLAIQFGPIVVALVALGLSLGWQSISRSANRSNRVTKVLQWLNAHRGPSVLELLGVNQGKLFHSIYSRLTAAKLGVLVSLFLGLQEAVQTRVRTQEHFGETVAHTLNRLRSVVFPDMVRAGVRVALVAAAAAAAIGSRALGRARRADRAARFARRKAAAALAAAAGALGFAHGLARDVTKDFTRARKRLGALEKDLARVRRWVKPLRRLGTRAGFAAATALALSRLGLGWLRCSSLRRMGNKIGCGGFGAMEQVLEDSIEVMAVTQLCAVATATAAVAESDEVQTILEWMVKATDFLCMGEGGLASGMRASDAGTAGWLPSAV